MTVKEAADYWLYSITNTIKRHSRNTISVYRLTVKNHIHGSAISRLSLVEANKPSILQPCLQHVAEHSGLAAARLLRIVLSSIFEAAARDEALQRNPVRLTSNPTHGKANTSPRQPGRAFTEAELYRLFQIIDNDEYMISEDMPDLLRFYLISGVRCNEGLQLRREDVDLQNQTMHIRGTKTQRSDRIIPLLPEIITIMQNRDTQNAPGYAFPAPINARSRKTTAISERKRDDRSVRKLVKLAMQKADLEWATIHTFRTTCGTAFVQKGKPINAAAAYLGDSVPTFLASYVSDKLAPHTLYEQLNDTPVTHRDHNF